MEEIVGNKDGFFEIQKHLNRMRGEIIPILQKKYDGITLLKEEVLKFKVYNDMSNRIYDLLEY